MLGLQLLSQLCYVSRVMLKNSKIHSSRSSPFFFFLNKLKELTFKWQANFQPRLEPTDLKIKFLETQSGALKNFMPLKNNKNELQTTKLVLQSKLSVIIDYVTLSLYFLGKWPFYFSLSSLNMSSCSIFNALFLLLMLKQYMSPLINFM